MMMIWWWDASCWKLCQCISSSKVKCHHNQTAFIFYRHKYWHQIASVSDK